MARRRAGRGPGREPQALHQSRRAAQRAPALQVPPAPADRLPRHPGRRRPDGDDGGAVPPGRRVSGRGVALGRGQAPASARCSRRLRRGAHRARGDRDGQAGRRRAQLFLGHRPDLRLRRGRPDDGRGGRERGQRRVLRRGGARHRGRAGVGDGRGPRLPRGPPAPAGGPGGRPHPVPGGLPRVRGRSRGALGAAGAHQGPLLRRRSRGRHALRRADPALRVPGGARPRHRGGDPADEERHRPLAPRQGRRAPQRQARHRRHPRGRVPRAGAPAPVRGGRSVAPREEHAARHLPAHRARLSLPCARPLPR